MTLAMRLPDLSQPRLPPPPPPPDPALLAAIRAEAEAAGHARGLLEGHQQGRAEEAATRDAEAVRCLGVIALMLDQAAEAGRMVAEQSAAAMARMLVAALDLTLADTLARHGAAVVMQVMAPLLPEMARRPEAVLRVAPDLVEAVAALLPQGAPPVVGDPDLMPGDGTLAWHEGRHFLSLARRRAAIHDALREAGFACAATADAQGDLES